MPGSEVLSAVTAWGRMFAFRVGNERKKRNSAMNDQRAAIRSRPTPCSLVKPVARPHLLQDCIGGGDEVG